MFQNEAEMQKSLKQSLETVDGLNDLITNRDYLENYIPTSDEEKKVLSSFLRTERSLNFLELISEDENISIVKNDALRPDFLFYSSESQGVVIVELKNMSGATREVGTELGAYSCEVRSYIPYLSEGDLFHVVISSCWPTLLRHYIFHEIFWNKKNIICLEPIKVDDSIMLNIISIESVIEADVGFNISDRHLAGYQVCLYDNYSYDRNADRNRLDKNLEQMKTAIQVMTSEGYRQRGNGFAFLWKDHLDISIAPYSISIFNMAPFKSIERFLHNITSMEQLSDIQKRFLKLIKWQSPTGHGDALHNIYESASPFLKKFSNPSIEGFHEWFEYKPMLLDRAE